MSPPLDKPLRSPLLAIVAGILSLSPITASAGGVGVSIQGHDFEIEAALPPQNIRSKAFHPYVVPSLRNPQASRDIQFHWSDTYDTLGARLDSLVAGQTDLDRLGITVCGDTYSNPFGFGLADIHLVVDYLNFAGVLYNRDDLFDPGFLIAPMAPFSGYPQLNSSYYAVIDRNHVDAYVYYPDSLVGGVAATFGDNAHGTNNRGATPSDFLYVYEDSIEGRAANFDSLRVSNDFSMAGPLRWQVGDTGPLRWTRPDTTANWVFCHEFQHAFNGYAVGPERERSEIFSSAAEALVGEKSENPNWDVPYTNSLTAAGNYGDWRPFTAYLVYNFRGTDLTQGGRSDDLIWRWAHAPGHDLHALGLSLTDSACVECRHAQRSYFDGLTASERLALLLHNWRVANYASNYSIAEHQYGFDPAFGFNPSRDVGNWRDIKGVLNDKSKVLPPEFTVDATWRHHERGFQYRPGGTTASSHSYPGRWMTISAEASEYVVYHASPSLDGTQDLVIRVTPDTLIRRRDTDGGCTMASTTGLLHASVIVYAADDDSLFMHPEYISSIQTQRVVLDSLRAPLEFTVSGFGSNTKAAVLVMSLAERDDPEYSVPGQGAGGHLTPHVWAGLRVSGQPALEPTVVSAASGAVERAPAFSHNSSDIAFEAKLAADPNHVQIYRVSVGGGTPSRVAPRSFDQHAPDWSPRGDLVAYVEDADTYDDAAVWVDTLATGGVRRVTNRYGQIRSPAFSPNGQYLAYAWRPHDEQGQWSLYRIHVDGTGDSLLATLENEPPTGLRWSTDGQQLWYVLPDEASPDGSPWVVAALGGTPVSGESRITPSRDVGVVQFHPGSNVMLEASRLNYYWTDNCGNVWCGCGEFGENWIAKAYSAIAFKDTLTGEEWNRFVPPSHDVRLIEPRLSSDGTRVAFVQTGAGADSANWDLYQSFITHNRAPSFTTPPPDDSLETGPTAHFDGFTVAASDPDGESVSFGTAYQPSGTTLNPATGAFSWPGIPPAGIYNVVFRAFDGSGGVAQKVARFKIDAAVPPAATPLTPELVTSSSITMSWTAPGDNGTQGTATEYDLRWSLNPINAGNWSVATPATGEPTPGPSGSTQSYTLSGLDPLTWYYVALRTRDEVTNWSALDSVLHMRTGQLGGGDDARAGNADGSSDPSAAIGPRTPSALGAVPTGDAPRLVIERGAAGEAPRWSACLRGSREVTEAADSVAAIRIEAPGDTVPWVTLTRIPDTFEGAIGLCAPGTATRRYVFPARYALGRFAASVVAAGASSPLGTAALENSRTGALTPGTDFSDAPPAMGDTLKASYQVVNDAGAKPENWFVRLYAAAQTTALSSEREGEAPAPPVSFALHPVRPNPFRNELTLAFDLPKESVVRLAVFDLQGREVARVVDGVRAAGRHSVTWSRSGSIPPGVYMCRMEAGTFRAQRKIVALP